MNNPKGDLIDHCRSAGLATPVFETQQTGPEHQPIFSTQISIDGQVCANGQGRTKRDAEKTAAQNALGALRDPSATPPEPEDLEPEGPWPIFPEVLAKSLEIANSRVEANKHGLSAIDEVSELALELYKSLIEDLGEYS